MNNQRTGHSHSRAQLLEIFSLNRSTFSGNPLIFHSNSSQTLPPVERPTRTGPKSSTHTTQVEQLFKRPVKMSPNNGAANTWTSLPSALAPVFG